ncbi:MAG: DUF305 domain-containing protein, partial [Rubrobacteraceae bacterium]
GIPRMTQTTTGPKTPGQTRLDNVAPWLPAAAFFIVAVASLLLYLDSRPPGDDSDEAGFARDMMVHHAQAVQMAELARDKTEDPTIRTMAGDMALTQQAQIGQMQGWLNIWGLPITGPEPAMAWMGHDLEGRMPGMASPEEIDELATASPEEADEIFLRLMIPHHEAAIPMSEAVLETTDEPAVRQLAEAIAISQEAEINVMENMLQAMGEEPPESQSMDHAGHEGHDH